MRILQTVPPLRMASIWLAAASVFLANASLFGQAGQTRGQQNQQPEEGIEILPVQGNIYMIAGAGPNITVLWNPHVHPAFILSQAGFPPPMGTEGVLVVNSGPPGMTDKILAAIKKIAGKPKPVGVEGRIRFIINTDGDLPDWGGNVAMGKEGRPVNNGDEALPFGRNTTAPANIVGHENVVKRMLAKVPGQSETPAEALPFNTYTGNGAVKDLFFDDDGIQIIHVPAAHTDGDSIVYFRRNDVLVAGNIFVTTGYPVIDLEHGGSLQGIIDGLNLLLDLAIPGHFEEDGTLIIPGYGRICDEADLLEYRDMLTIIRNRMEAMIKKGATLEQVRQAGLTRDFDPLYGAGGPGAWPTAKFVEAAYQSLTQKAKK